MAKFDSQQTSGLRCPKAESRGRRTKNCHSRTVIRGFNNLRGTFRRRVVTGESPEDTVTHLKTLTSCSLRHLGAVTLSHWRVKLVTHGLHCWGGRPELWLWGGRWGANNWTRCWPQQLGMSSGNCEDLNSKADHSSVFFNWQKFGVGGSPNRFFFIHITTKDKANDNNTSSSVARSAWSSSSFWITWVIALTRCTVHRWWHLRTGTEGCSKYPKRCKLKCQEKGCLGLSV